MSESEKKHFQYRIWRVNVRTRMCSMESIPEEWETLGGRGLLARILVDEVPGTCEPLGPYNKLIFAPGLLVGHMLSSCDRISIGGKSPLTGGVKEANAGGTTGLQMTYLGIKALIIDDAPESSGLWILHISKEGIRFDPADHIRGLGVFESSTRLLSDYGSNVAIALIGPGGEMRLPAAGIQNLDKDRLPSRIAARGGLGAVMGAKGIKALIIEDAPESSGLWILHISKEGIRFDPADHIRGLGVFETSTRLLSEYGRNVAIALIGPGGEMRLPAAGIQNLDKDRLPSRIAARGGLGAVMGAKGIKAIVINARDGAKPPLHDPEAFKLAQKAFTKALMDHPQTAIYRDYGTAAMARMCNGFGGLPTRNFSSGQFDQVEQISGEYMRQVILQRGGEGEPTHACMPGCTIRCSNNYPDEKGSSLVSPLEYETIGLMGSNLGIASLDQIARLNWAVNDLGLDSIEIGAALGVAAEAGLMNFGDGDRAQQLLDEIRQGTPLGRILGNGATISGRVFGVERVPAVKGQAMSAYEPRAIKGTGVTYATSPQGADHTSGLTIRAKVNHLDPQGQAALSRTLQINMAGYDTLGACIFAGFGFASAPEAIRDLLNARYGWKVESDILQVLGRESLRLEREFNRRAGFTQSHDRLPEWMTREPLPPTNAKFDVPAEDLDSVFNW